MPDSKDFDNSLINVSVLMPVYNEAHYIQRSLGSVLNQNYPLDNFEIIVADGCSKDGTADIVQSMMRNYPNLQLISNPGKIVSTGLNAALKLARGDIIIRIDGHCEIGVDYISRCVKYLSNDSIDGIGGVIETIGETPVSSTIAAAMSSRFGVGGAAFRVLKSEAFDNPIKADTVPFPAYRRSIINRAGPFDEHLVRNQDDEYNYRLRKIGANILIAPDIYSRYYSRSSLKKVIEQYFQYGFWKVRVLQKHPRQMKARQFIPPLFVMSLIVSLVITMISSKGLFLSGAIIVSYMIGAITASLITKPVSYKHRLFLLPFVYASLHISYGAGFIIGIIRFADICCISDVVDRL